MNHVGLWCVGHFAGRLQEFGGDSALKVGGAAATKVNTKERVFPSAGVGNCIIIAVTGVVSAHAIVMRLAGHQCGFLPIVAARSHCHWLRPLP